MMLSIKKISKTESQFNLSLFFVICAKKDNLAKNIFLGVENEHLSILCVLLSHSVFNHMLVRVEALK